jgi:Family of unknown function (DUF6505)
MKLLRTIRLDASDTFIFPAAAEPGEWAISGAFAFDAVPEALTGRKLAAFRGGFLGIPSLGWSTLVQVVDAKANDRAVAIDLLARCLIERYGVPDLDAARAAAGEEVDFAASLAEHPTGTLIAVRRTLEADTIREAFRTLQPRMDSGAWRVFAFGEATAEEEPMEGIDLTGLARGERS